jgi:N-acetylglutamate synthase-like GNAT family acetyltransferase
MPTIVPLEHADLVALKAFTDRTIGEGYYSAKELEEIFEKSSADDRDGKRHMCSLLLRGDAGEILGVRFSYPPGKWSKGKGEGLNPAAWPRKVETTGYFQSLFLSDKVQGQGWGAKLSLASIAVLKKIGASGVVCHSWKESPFNSSSKYLEKMGFQKIAEHPLYWQHVNYNCTRCLKPPCLCTAVEMYLDIETEKETRESR